MRRDEIRARLAAADSAPGTSKADLFRHARDDLAILLEAADRFAALVALLERGCEVGTGYGACCSRRCENAAEDETAWLRENGLA